MEPTYEGLKPGGVSSCGAYHRWVWSLPMRDWNQLSG